MEDLCHLQYLQRAQHQSCIWPQCCICWCVDLPERFLCDWRCNSDLRVHLASHLNSSPRFSFHRLTRTRLFFSAAQIFRAWVQINNIYNPAEVPKVEYSTKNHSPDLNEQAEVEMWWRGTRARETPSSASTASAAARLWATRWRRTSSSLSSSSSSASSSSSSSSLSASKSIVQVEETILPGRGGGMLTEGGAGEAALLRGVVWVQRERLFAR